MNKEIILIISILIFTIPYFSAVCTLNIETDIESPVVKVIVVCNHHSEESQIYTINWTNSSNYQIEIDKGITPSKKNTPFYETLKVPRYMTSGSILNVSMKGKNLEGKDSAVIMFVKSKYWYWMIYVLIITFSYFLYRKIKRDRKRERKEEELYYDPFPRKHKNIYKR